VLADKALLGPDDLGIDSDELPAILTLAAARERWQRQYINEVLSLNGGNRTRTARDLGVDPRTIFRHLEREESTAVPTTYCPPATTRELAIHMASPILLPSMAGCPAPVGLRLRCAGGAAVRDPAGNSPPYLVSSSPTAGAELPASPYTIEATFGDPNVQDILTGRC